VDQGIQVNAPLAVGLISGGGYTGEIAGEVAPRFVSLPGRSGATQLSSLPVNERAG
jgi:hypothetical protein